MTEAWLSLLAGVVVCVASAVLLRFCAKRRRLAPPPSQRADEGLATVLGLALVSLIVVGGAWIIKGAMLLVPDASAGLAVGFLVLLVSLFVTWRILGKVPDDGSTARDPSSVGKSRSPTAGNSENA